MTRGRPGLGASPQSELALSDAMVWICGGCASFPVLPPSHVAVHTGIFSCSCLALLQPRRQRGLGQGSSLHSLLAARRGGSLHQQGAS